MPNKFFFWAAACWTAIIAVLCLISFNELPSVGIEIEDADKYVHAAFHFLFTILWYLYFRKQYHGMTNVKVLFTTLAFSIVYGILIEIAQELFTITRHADMKDVLANLSGAVLGILTITVFSAAIYKNNLNK